jgi:hypothetical protein
MRRDSGDASSNVNRFSPASANSARPNTEVPISSLAILVVALATVRINVGDLTSLRATLSTLSSADSFDRERVLVAVDDGQVATSQLIQEEFFMRKIEVRATRDFTDPAQRSARFYRGALEHAAKNHFGRSRSIIVIQEGVQVAPDFHW